MMTALIGPAASAQDDSEGRRKSSARLEAMRRLVKEVKVCEVTEGKPGPPLALRPDPLLRYTNPTLRVIDGTLWAWGERGRPTAVLKLGFIRQEGDPSHWRFRVNVLSPKPIEVEFPDGPTWTSRTPGLELRPLPNAPAPTGSAAQRLAQAKAMARRFSASAKPLNQSGRTQFRLLTQPIARYSDQAAGLLDGVFFSFVYTNNPSVLLVLETWSEGAGVSTWRYALVRQGAGEYSALLDGKPVWSVPAAGPPADAGLFIVRQMSASPAEQD